jgi:hypothetical protein
VPLPPSTAPAIFIAEAVRSRRPAASQDAVRSVHATSRVGLFAGQPSKNVTHRALRGLRHGAPPTRYSRTILIAQQSACRTASCEHAVVSAHMKANGTRARGAASSNMLACPRPQSSGSLAAAAAIEPTATALDQRCLPIRRPPDRFLRRQDAAGNHAYRTMHRGN